MLVTLGNDGFKFIKKISFRLCRDLKCIQCDSNSELFVKKKKRELNCPSIHCVRCLRKPCGEESMLKLVFLIYLWEVLDTRIHLFKCNAPLLTQLNTLTKQ